MTMLVAMLVVVGMAEATGEQDLTTQQDNSALVEQFQKITFQTIIWWIFRISGLFFLKIVLGV